MASMKLAERGLLRQLYRRVDKNGLGKRTKIWAAVRARKLHPDVSRRLNAEEQFRGGVRAYIVSPLI